MSEPSLPAPAIFVHTSEPAALNSYLIIGTERAVIIDTGAGPAQAAGILDAFTAVLAQHSDAGRGTELPIVAVNTHDHWDHFFGNAHFAACGVEEFFGSPAFARDQSGSAWLQFHSVPLEAEPHLPADPSELAVEVTALADGAVLDIGGWQLHAYEMPGHTDTDLVLACADVVFTGDLVEEGAPPQAGDDATPSRWAAGLRELAALPGAEVFAPGHGQPVDAGFVRRQAEDIAALAADPDHELAAVSAAPFSFADGTGLPAGVRRLR